MILQTTGNNGLLWKLINRAMVESHIEEDFTFTVDNIKKLDHDYREAIKKEYDIQEVEENDILISFTESSGEQMQDDKTETKEEKPVEEKPADEKPQEDPDGQEQRDLEEAVMRIWEEEGADETPAKDEKVDDASSKENKEADELSGTTAKESEGKEKLIKAVARSLYIENEDDIATFDVPYNGKKMFFIKVKIRK